MRGAVIALLAIGCAEGADAEAVAVSDSTSVAETVAADTYVGPTDGPMESIFAVEDTAPAPPPKLCDTPMGATATASGSYDSTPAMALDKSLGTVWNAGAGLGWLRIKLPSPVHFDRVQIAGHASPACNETYTIHAGSAKIGEGTRALTATNAWLDPIAIAPGTYDEILIDVALAESWIAIAEVRLFDSTGACP